MLSSSDAPRTLLAYLFRSCVAFYNAKPWKVLGGSDNVRLNVDIEAPIFARISGAETGSPPGLSLTSAYTTAEELEIAEEELAIAARDLEIPPEELEKARATIAFAGARLAMTFVPEHEAPQSMRETRRANKWPLASPAAFPTVSATEIDGTTRALHEDELRALCVAINVVATFTATKRKHIESGQPFGDVITVRDDAGAPRIALVQFPFDPDAPEGWQSYKQHHDDGSGANPALQEIRNAALDLPDVEPILERLVWSFFQASDPHYLLDEDDQDDAMQRFLTWAIFGYRGNGMSLAERALVRLGATKSSEELEVYHRVVYPRAGIFRIVTVKRDVGMQLHDVMLGDTLDVVERVGTRGLRADNGLMGTLHPISDTQWVMSPGAVMYPTITESDIGDEKLSPEAFAPEAEASVFGANVEWIQELDTESLSDVYGLFADAIAETGDAMPTYEELQRDIARAEQPSALAQQFAGQVWWSQNELQVMLAFLMRAWNLTPREELQGKSPDEKFVERGQVRASPRGGGRRRR